MAVLLETNAGDLVIDLYTDDCPVACRNFLSLCAIKYYNGCLFYNVQSNFIAQTGDPSGTGKGGNSIFGIIEKKNSISFKDEINKKRKFDQPGLVCMAHEKEDCNKSQFFVTLRGGDLEHMEENFTVFGIVAEGFEVLEKINNLYCDEDGRPYQDVRIKHTCILDDPFDPLPGIVIPPSSPTHVIPPEETVKGRIPFDESLEPGSGDGRTEEEVEASIKRKEAHSRAMVLEMTGDIPDAEVKPPDEVLFVCKLNAVTTDADLELIFSRFGAIRKCEIIRDFKTGDSLNYAFIEFETEESCIQAYEKMNNVLIDDRRIKVDFSQSVSQLWNKYLQRPRKGAGGGGPQSGPPGVAKRNPEPRATDIKGAVATSDRDLVGNGHKIQRYRSAVSPHKISNSREAVHDNGRDKHRGRRDDCWRNNQREEDRRYDRKVEHRRDDGKEVSYRRDGRRAGSIHERQHSRSRSRSRDRRR